MNLFNYLMNKNDKEIVDNNHMLEYLLNAGKLTTITGTELNIISKKRKINELLMTKESTQETTTGKNLLDIEYFENGSIDATTGENIDSTANGRGSNYIPVLPNTTYTLSTNTNITNLRLSEYTAEKVHIQRDSVANNDKLTITTTANTYYLRWSLNYDNITVVTKELVSTLDLELELGSTRTSYEPYTGGIAAPNSQFPMEVKTVKGYRNLFDKSLTPKVNNQAQATILDTGLRITNSTAGTYRYCIYSLFDVSSYVGKKLTLHVDISASASNSPSLNLILCDSNGENRTNIAAITQSGNITITVPTLTGTSTYLGMTFYANTNGNANANDYVEYTNIILVEGTEEKPYVSYGNNWIYINITGKNLAKNFTNGENGNPYSNALYIDFDIKPSTTYTFSFKGANGNIIYRNNSIFSDAAVNITCNGNRQDITLTTVAEIPANQYITDKGWVVFRNQNGNIITPNFSEVQVEKGSTLSSYEQYKESIITLPLNGNEVDGIGDYKDDYIIDKTGHCYLKKKTGKMVLNGSESGWYTNLDKTYTYQFILNGFADNLNLRSCEIKSNYFYNKLGNPSDTTNEDYALVYNYLLAITIRKSITPTLTDFKSWLSTHNTDVYYVLETPQLIDLNYIVDLRLFKGVNIISNSDDMTMVLKYYS